MPPFGKYHVEPRVSPDRPVSAVVRVSQPKTVSLAPAANVESASASTALHTLRSQVATSGWVLNSQPSWSPADPTHPGGVMDAHPGQAGLDEGLLQFSRPPCILYGKSIVEQRISVTMTARPRIYIGRRKGEGHRAGAVRADRAAAEGIEATTLRALWPARGARMAGGKPYLATATTQHTLRLRDRRVPHRSAGWTYRPCLGRRRRSTRLPLIPARPRRWHQRGTTGVQRHAS